MSQSNYVSLTVADGTHMQAYAALPTGTGPFPAIIVFQEAFGVNAHLKDLTERFAAQGYVAIAPELYHRTAAEGFVAAYTDFAAVAPHLQALTEPGLEADIQACWHWLQTNDSVIKEKIACTGYCMGGRVSFLANTILPLKAAISYYGGRIAPDLVKRAPALHAPMLFCWGGLDKHIPQEQIDAVTAELKKENKPFASIVFSYADHGFFCDERAAYEPHSARQAWALTLEFLRS